MPKDYSEFTAPRYVVDSILNKLKVAQDNYTAVQFRGSYKGEVTEAQQNLEAIHEEACAVIQELQRQAVQDFAGAQSNKITVMLESVIDVVKAG